MNNTPPIIYVDMDNVLVDFPSAFKHYDPQYLDTIDDKDEIDGIFSKMEPMQHAIAAVEFLATHFDVFILSTAPWNNPSAWTDKLNWIKKYLPEVCHKKLILSHNKQLNIGDYLIDDRLKNGVIGFKGEHIHFGTGNFPDWKSVIKYLIKKENINLKNFTFENKDTTLLYLGGINGTRDSTTYTALKKHCKNIAYISYDKKNVELAKTQIENEVVEAQKKYKNVLLCGNSLGGYWANYFSEQFHIPCLLINPSLNPKANLEKYGFGKNMLSSFKESTFYYKNKIALLGKNDDVVNNKLNAQKLNDIESIVWVDEGHRLLSYDVLIELIIYKLIFF